MRPHSFIPSNLGHGETMCQYCFGTNRELAALGRLDHCEKAPPASGADAVQELKVALANMTDAFLNRHGCFPLDKTNDKERHWCAAMSEAYRLVGQPDTPARAAALSPAATSGSEAGGEAVALEKYRTAVLSRERTILEMHDKSEAVIAGLNKQLTEQFELTTKLAAQLDAALAKPASSPAGGDVVVTPAMVNAAWNVAKDRRMTGLPTDFRAVLEAALSPSTSAAKPPVVELHAFRSPEREGFFWARWHTPAPGTADNGECCNPDEWQVCQVFENCLDEASPGHLMVFVPGVERAQPLDAFEWGQEVRRV